MPYKSKSKRTYRRKYVRRTRRRKATLTAKVPRYVTGMADRQMVKMKYSRFVSLSAGAGSPAVEIFRGNSIYDPHFGAGTDQPLTFTQWTAFYSRYVVRGAKIKVSFVNTGTNTILVTIIPKLVTTTTSGTVLTTERAYNVHRMLCPTTTGSNNSCYLTRYMSSTKMFGVRSGEIGGDDSNYSATITANPNQIWYYHVQAQDMASGSVTCDALVEIVYYVQFYQRTAPSQSNPV